MKTQITIKRNTDSLNRKTVVIKQGIKSITIKRPGHLSDSTIKSGIIQSNLRIV